MRELSPVELATLVAVGGSVLAVAIPTFARNVRASYVSEATRGVEQIAGRVAARLDAEGKPSALPPSAPLTPAEVPRGERVTDPPGTWDHPTWVTLDFRLEVPHAYSFALDTEASKDEATFTARAAGDLDGDAVTSRIEVQGRYRPSGVTELSEVSLIDELE